MIQRRNTRRQVLTTLLATAMAGGVPFAQSVASAENYPSHTVRMLVGYSAGGGVDALARTLAVRLSEQFGQSVIVDNRPGATSTIAGNVLALAPADGYTLLLADSSLLIAARAMQNLTFDPVTTFVPVAGVAIAPLAIAVAADSPLRSLEDIAKAANAGQTLTFATSGIGTVHHLAMEHLQAQAKIKLTHVPYRGASALLPDLISGQVSMGVLSAAAALSQVKAGKIRVLGLTSEDKVHGAADWRAIADWLPGFDASPRLFVLARAGTPASVVSRLEGEIGKALSDDVLVRELSKQGFVTTYRSAKDMKGAMQKELDRWTDLIRQSGITLK